VAWRDHLGPYLFYSIPWRYFFLFFWSLLIGWCLTGIQNDVLSQTGYGEVVNVAIHAAGGGTGLNGSYYIGIFCVFFFVWFIYFVNHINIQSTRFKLQHFCLPTSGPSNLFRVELYNPRQPNKFFCKVTKNRLFFLITFQHLYVVWSILINYFKYYRWQGYMQPHFSENYTLIAVCDDGCRVYLEGNLLIDAWGAKPLGISFFFF
jgi:hypothetical protein